jgi:hypothetical protein
MSTSSTTNFPFLGSNTISGQGITSTITVTPSNIGGVTYIPANNPCYAGSAELALGPNYWVSAEHPIGQCNAFGGKTCSTCILKRHLGRLLDKLVIDPGLLLALRALESMQRV